MSCPVTNLVQRLDAKRNGAGWKAKCPAHDDRVPSLSINKGEDGRVLLKCHRGCAIDDILIAIGWTKKDLFPANDRAGNSGPVAVYDYTDEDGELLFQVCRFEPKDFRQRRPDGNGGWIWSTRDVRRVLYQLPKIVAAQRVAIAEGEKDCNAITKSGIVATCNSWRRW
jgi:hypothetical protein